VILGQILHAPVQGQNPARQAAIGRRRRRTRRPRFGINQLCGSGLRAVALAAAADRARAMRHRGGRRAGEHEPGAACRAICATAPKMGDAGVRRHHDQGRAVGRLPRLPHGQHRRERGAASTRSPATSRTRSPPPASTRPSAAQKAGRFKDEIVPVDGQDPQGRRGGGQPTSTSQPRRHRRDAWRKLRPAFAKDGTVTAGNAVGHQ
jgi:acetyl-CoA C-acetyltransferase